MLHARAIDQSAKVAVSHGHGRDGYQFVSGLPDGEALESEEEKGFVPSVVDLGYRDGPTDRSSEFIAHQVGRRKVGWILPGFGDADGVVPGSFEHGTMQLVGSRLGGKDGRCGGRKLRAGVYGLDFHFLHGVRVG